MKLSKSAEGMLVRQSLKTIRALEKRLTTCPLEKFEEVKALLLAERRALGVLIKDWR